MPCLFRRLARLLAVAILFVSGGATAIVLDCAGGSLSPGGTGVEDVQIKTPCVIKKGTHLYKNVNIYSDTINNTKGDVCFEDGKTDFWAQSIIVESGGTLRAGTLPACTPGAITPHKGPLTIWLWGPTYANGAKGIGASCVMTNCGVPATAWTTGDTTKVTLPGVFAIDPTAAQDFFYKYDPLPYDDGNATGYYGYKVLGVGWGGSILLYGKKGATYTTLTNDNSGTSWARLAVSVPTPANATDEIEIDRDVDWVKNDEIVVTTTDYLPGHSEQLRITTDPVKVACTGAPPATTCHTRFKVQRVDGGGGLRYSHVGSRFPLPSEMVTKLGLKDRQDADVTSMENRAAVALLSRSITIRSGGSTIPKDPTVGNFGDKEFIGGHTIVRQGVQQYQVQGVEFKQLGQGGRIGHYPVHFHMARHVPDDTYVKDSSVNESMTRWFVLHGTGYATLQRNVGWKSIGHGYYLEDGTEVNNKLYSNLGIWARPAIVDTTVNPRQVPGILAADTAKGLYKLLPNTYTPELVPFYSDYDHPSLFWIMNAWNDFEGNLAVGAGGCGVCYWLLPGAMSGHSRHASWTGYASLQAPPAPPGDPTGRGGLTPLQRFTGNYCSAAAMSFLTVGNTAPCLGIGGQYSTVNEPLSASVKNELAPKPCLLSNPFQPKPNETQPEPNGCSYDGKLVVPPATMAADDYYPKIGGGGRFPTKLPNETADFSTYEQCGVGFLDRCMVTVIDRYTSSFHWAETNASAIWLRPTWYLLTNSFITDLQNGGLTFVTGGGYTDSDTIPGHWALASKTVFIGQTQASNPLASAGSPVNPLKANPSNQFKDGLKCDQKAGGGFSGNHCLVAREGVSFPLSSFSMNQRMFNIYDGPAYQEANGYLNIKPITLDCQDAGTCANSLWLSGRINGVPKKGTTCYLPNAAIAWKQPNGFFYPPAFHSNNLYFGAGVNDVEIRHFVLQPLFNPGTYVTNETEAAKFYCTGITNLFASFTDIDRQTELNDDDGSLTGYVNTISVNEDPFFAAPKEGFECASDAIGKPGTAKTSPYDYVTTVVYPSCASTNPMTCPDVPIDPKNPQALHTSWGQDCATPDCAGVPLYRQYIAGSDTTLTHPAQIRMAGQSTFQRSTLTLNHGKYYIDTTPGGATQWNGKPTRTNLNVFVKGEIYYTFLLFAKPTTKQTYQLYVGKNFKPADFVPVKVDPSKVQPAWTPIPMPAGWSVTPPDSKGVITVTMDMTFMQAEYDKALTDRCGPATFCALVSKSGGPLGGKTQACGCARTSYPSGPKLDSLCDEAACAWASKDTMCGSNGCYGFGFKLADDFQIDVQGVRPAGMCFDPNDTNWTQPNGPTYPNGWRPATQGVAGTACLNYKVADNFCGSPQPPVPPVGK